jgi:TIR domain
LTGIEVGDPWQHKIYDALEGCAAAAILLSPPFLESKMCKDEFNIAYARDAALPTYMRLINYTDCRIDDHAKISAAAKQLVRKVRVA